MILTAQSFNEKNLTSLKHILIAGNDDYLKQSSFIKIQNLLDKFDVEKAQLFNLDQVGFKWELIFSLASNGSLFNESNVIALSSQTALKKSQHDLLNILFGTAKDCYFIVILNKLTKAQEKQSWIKSCHKDGLYITADPIPQYKLPQLVKQRFHEKSLQTTQQGYELLTDFYQGNLLGLEQEIEKLSLIFTSGMIPLDELKDCISNQSHNTVFQCVDLAIDMKPLQSQQVLRQLKRDKAQPAILLWSIIKELRELANMKFELVQGKNLASVLESHYIWQSKKNMFSKQLQTHSLAHFYKLIQQAKLCDESIKGLSPILAWQSLEKLVFDISNH